MPGLHSKMSIAPDLSDCWTRDYIVSRLNISRLDIMLTTDKFSGMLSFITYELLKNPHAYAKVRDEVDAILQGKTIRPEDLSKFPYIVAVMREGLRLYPPAPMIGLTPFEDTVLGGEYFIAKGNITAVPVAWMMRDPVVWGEDVRCFLLPLIRVTDALSYRLKCSSQRGCSTANSRPCL
jgi:Cytochrome P450